MEKIKFWIEYRRSSREIKKTISSYEGEIVRIFLKYFIVAVLIVVGISFLYFFVKNIQLKNEQNTNLSSKVNDTKTVSSPSKSESNQVKDESQLEPKDRPRAETLPKPASIATEGKKVVYASRITDGDTIEADGKKIRIIGLNTPETKDPRKPVECFGQEPSLRISQIIGSNGLILEYDPTQDQIDRYGRHLMHVYLSDGTNVAYTMINEGYAYEYTYRIPYIWQSQYKQAQDNARSMGRGLWAPGVCN